MCHRAVLSLELRSQPDHVLSTLLNSTPPGEFCRSYLPANAGLRKDDLYDVLRSMVYRGDSIEDPKSCIGAAAWLGDSYREKCITAAGYMVDEENAIEWPVFALIAYWLHSQTHSCSRQRDVYAYA